MHEPKPGLLQCMNSSLKQRLRTSTNPQQAFLLACHLSTSRGQCDFYEVTAMIGSLTNASTFILDYDLWTSSKKNHHAKSSNITFA